MTDDDRTRIELEIEVDATPEEVWEAIATGPGVTSWYVPHVIEEHEGGQATARFGDGEGMEVPGRVAAWEPPNRIVIDGGEHEPGLAFEWLVEARDGGSCVVRLVNTGFGDDGPWDEMYDGMLEGWPMFLRNLQLHLTHFKGQAATPMLAGGLWAGPRQAAWKRLAAELGFDLPIEVGGTGDTPELAGTVAEVAPTRISVVLDRPAPGTAIIAAEGGQSETAAEGGGPGGEAGDLVGVSVWPYLYGSEASAVIERDRPRWAAWLAERSVQPD